MGAKTSLERAGDTGPDEAAQHAGNERKQNFDRSGEAANAVGDENAGQAPDIKLSLGANVEQPGLEAEREGKPKKDIRCCRHQRFGERIMVCERALEERRQRLDRVRTGDENSDASHDEAADDRRQWDNHGADEP